MLNIVDYKKFYTDSRGLSLNSSSDVLVYSRGYVDFSVCHINTKMNEKSEIYYYILDNTLGYVFRLTEDEKKLLKNKLCRLKDESSNNKIWSIGLDYKSSNLIFTMESVRESIYMKENNKSNVRGIKMDEITGKPLSLGDYVIYFERKPAGTIGYGIVISDTKIYTDKNIIETHHLVYKPEEYTEDEIELKNALTVNYKKYISSCNKTKELEKTPGMVFKGNNYLYIYLGKCKSKLNYIKPSKYDIVYKLDGNKEVYLKLSSSLLNVILTIPDSYFNNPNNFLGKYKIKNVEQIVDNRLILTYKSVDNLDIFVTKVDSKISYVGKINPNIKIQILKDIYMELY